MNNAHAKLKSQLIDPQNCNAGVTPAHADWQSRLLAENPFMVVGAGTRRASHFATPEEAQDFIAKSPSWRKSSLKLYQASQRGQLACDSGRSILLIGLHQIAVTGAHDCCAEMAERLDGRNLAPKTVYNCVTGLI